MSHTELNCRSKYIAMRDGVRSAVSTWLGNNKESGNRKSLGKRLAVKITTRYWRAMTFT